jgi:hypothetical protein
MALLSGDVDAIEGVPTTDLAAARQDPTLVFARKVSARLVYLYIDSGRESYCRQGHWFTTPRPEESGRSRLSPVAL